MWFIKMASMIHPSGSALLIKVELSWLEEKAPSCLCQHPLVSSLTTGILRSLSRKLWREGGDEQRLIRNSEICWDFTFVRVCDGVSQSDLLIMIASVILDLCRERERERKRESQYFIMNQNHHYSLTLLSALLSEKMNQGGTL